MTLLDRAPRGSRPLAAGSPAPAGRRRRTFTVRRGLGLLAFLAPALVFVAVFTYHPLLKGSQMAFQRWNLFDLRNTPFVGLDNFSTLLADPTFWTVLQHSVIWVVGSIVPQLLIGFGLALLLRRRFRFRGVYQALVFFPWAVSGFLIGILFRWMFNGEFGVVNDLLRKAGLIDTNIAWLADPQLAMVSVIIANVWYGVTFFAIMLLAALQSVPDELLEAGALDGAGRARTLFFIVIPFIRTTLLLTVLLRVIWVFNFPEIIYGMTGGGPADQTHIVTSWMINFTSQGDYGLASALGLIVLAVLVLFASFYLLALKERDAR
ncbi:multiple sugar transport system permease protein [Friedmanniella luteola]|uniref:Multiple sugar transport system permease protein n=1 Tax=Friedmanniella luteola TaxID=546871 RepID=A0A1H1LKX2_9ACTN|nr:sugar ABC transporter permease [Friedmanniella luteola]SDR74519.1 multiple sugar transport system permease protein [Friedmanniella luteola]